MCLAVPAKVLEINGDQAVAELDGIKRSVNISLVEDLQIGEYVLLHAGFAIQKWTEEDVQELHEIQFFSDTMKK